MRVNNWAQLLNGTNSEEVMVSADYDVFKCDEKKLLPKYLNHYSEKQSAWDKQQLLIAGKW